MLSRTRTNLALAVMVGLLAMASWLLREPEPQPAAAWIDPASSTPARIEVLHHGELRMELLREADNWILQHPFRRRADAARVDYLLGLIRATPARIDRPGEVDLQGAGLAPAAWSLRLDGGITIELGAIEALGQRRYVRQGDKVALLPDRWQPLLEAGATALAGLELAPPGRELRMVSTPLARIERHGDTWSARPQVDGDAAAMAQAWRQTRALGIRALPTRTQTLGEIRLVSDQQPDTVFELAEIDDGLALRDIAGGYELFISAEQADSLLRPPPFAPPELD